MNWDNIKYIFQIPLNWYKAIHNKVFKAYGTNFIVVKEGYQGGMEITVDDEIFKNAIEDINVGNVKSVDYVFPDVNGNIPLNAVRTVNGHEPDIDGNVDIESDGDVKSVNDILPDDDGNIELDVVTSVDGIEPDNNGNVQLNAVKSVNSVTPDENGNVEVDAGDVKSVNDVLPDDDGNIELDVVTSVDGIEPDNNGNISFNIGNNKWVKTDSVGHLTAAITEPITLDVSKKGFMFNNNGAVEYQNKQFVDFDTQQTITAKKIWQGGAQFNNDVTVVGSKIQITNTTASGNGATILHNQLNLDGDGAYINIGSTTEGRAQIFVHSGDKRLGIYKDEGIELRGNANGVVLGNQPTATATDSRAVATVGYCQTRFSKASHTHGNINNNGTITNMGSGVTTDYIIVANSDGNLYRKAKSDIVPNVVNITTGQITDWNTATSNFATKSQLKNYATLDDLDGYVTADDLDGYATKGELQDFVTQDQVNGFLTQNDFSAGFPASTFNTQSGSIDVVTNVSWNDSSIVVTLMSLNFANGLFVGSSAGGTSTIPTVVFEGV